MKRHTFVVKVVCSVDDTLKRADLANKLEHALEWSTAREALASAIYGAVSFQMFDEGPEADALRADAKANAEFETESVSEYAPVCVTDQEITDKGSAVQGSVMIWRDAAAFVEGVPKS